MKSPYYYRVSRSNYIFFFVFFAFGVRLSGQTSNEMPLIQVLDSLSGHHNVNFSYLSRSLDTINISCPDFDENLQVNLIWIAAHTGLTIDQTGQNDYAVLFNPSNLKTFCGKLIDEETSEPIDGAMVFTNTNFTLSISKGFFSLSTLQDDKIQIRHLGYEPQLIDPKIQNSGCPTISVTPNATILEEIDVYNYMSEGINKAADGSILLSVNPSRLLPGQVEADVLHALRFLPGIQSVNESVSDLNIRGGTMDQNLILFDGMRVYQQGHFFGQLSVFNPLQISQATVIKQGTSAQYGDAVSGTILLETEDQVSSSTNTTIGTNLLYADLGVSLPLGTKASMKISGRRSTENILKTPIYHNYFNKSFSNTEVRSDARDSLTGITDNFHFNDGSIQINYKPNNRTFVKISGISVKNELGFDEQGILNNNLITKTSRLEQNSQIASMTIKRKLRDQSKTSLQLGVSRYKLFADNHNIEANQLIQQENQVLDYQLKSVTQILGQHHDDWLFGYQFNNIGVLNSNKLNTPIFRNVEKLVNSTHAVFGEYYRVISKLQLQIGTRFQFYQEARRLVVEPRASIYYELYDNMKVHLTAERKSQTLFQKIDLQEDFFGIEKRRWRFPNLSDFLLIESKQLSVGYQYERFRWLIEVEGFYKKTLNIRSLSQGFVNQLEKLNLIGSNAVIGGELLSTYQYKDIRVWSSYSYMNNDYSFPDFIPPVFPNNTDIPHNASLGSTYRYKEFEVAGALTWRSGTPYTGIKSGLLSGSAIAYQNPNQLRTYNYLRSDISLQHQHTFGKSKIISGASFWNILNRKNIIRKFYTQDDMNEWKMIENMALPFTFNVFVRWTWLN